MAMGAVRKLAGEGGLFKKMLFNSRTMAAGGALGTYAVGKRLINLEGQTLKSFYGETAYADRYMRGQEALGSMLTAGSIAAGALGVLYGPRMTRAVGSGIKKIGRGIGQTGRGIGYMGRHAVSAVGAGAAMGAISPMLAAGAGAAAIASPFVAAYGTMRVGAKLAGALRPSRIASGVAGAGRAMSARVLSGSQRHWSKVNRTNTFRQMGEGFVTGTGRLKNQLGQRAVAALRTVDPANWSSRSNLRAGLGLMAGGAMIGPEVRSMFNRYPIMEAGNVSFASKVTQRMNFDTAGLTQALHDRRNRML